MDNKNNIKTQRFILGKSKVEWNWKFVRKILIIIFFNFISVVVITKLILSTKIYIPGFMWIAQTIIYSSKEVIDRWTLASIFELKNLFFFLIGFLINVPFVIAAYFYIGKNYAKFSLFSIVIWTFLGCLLSLRALKSDVWLNFLEFNISADLEERTKDVRFYIAAFCAGFFIGITNSVLWRQNISAGGLDYVYTYLAIRKKKEISKISLPIILGTVMISILINEASDSGFGLVTFVSQLIASVVLSYTRNALINYLYPKYKIMTVFIITSKGKEVCAELKKFYRHGGSVIQSKGLYDQKEKEIIITAMTHLEKNLFIQRLIKVDANAFFLATPVKFIEGKFNFLNN